MENFKIWIYSLCGSGVITSVFKILVSNSNVKKSVNIFLSMFVFLYTILPIENIINDFEIKIDNEYESNSYLDYYKDGYESIIKECIKNVCEKYNVVIYQINIDSYIDNNGFCVVKGIELELNNKSKNSVIEKEIREKYGYEVTII